MNLELDKSAIATELIPKLDKPLLALIIIYPSLYIDCLKRYGNKIVRHNPGVKSKFRALVQAHAALRAPVGSLRCANSMSKALAATIRNALASLEGRGTSISPATSAGRVPTEKGYRFYVTQCMTDEVLSTIMQWNCVGSLAKP